MIRRIHSVATVLAFVAAACGGELNDSAVPDTAGGEVAMGADVTEANAMLDEWRIDMPSDTLSPGRYTFRVQNAGEYTHALEIEGKGEEWETDRLPASGRGELTVNLEPGVYEAYCPVEDAHGKHRDLGMRRTLVVRE